MIDRSFFAGSKSNKDSPKLPELNKRDPHFEYGVAIWRGLLVAALRRWGSGLCDQPDGRGSLPGAALDGTHEVRSCRGDDAGEQSCAPTRTHTERCLPTAISSGAIAVLARATQGVIWGAPEQSKNCGHACGSIIASSRPSPASATPTLPCPISEPILAITPIPAETARLTKARILAELRRASRQRRLDDTATRIQEALRRPQLRQPPLVGQALGRNQTGSRRWGRLVVRLHPETWAGQGALRLAPHAW
ncbi:hypothetical protein [Rhodococcus koreensis]